MYIPTLAIISHYFQRHRALALGIASTVGSHPLLFFLYSSQSQGSAFGGAIHPIMLNSLFHGSVGFNSGVKVSAGLIAGLLIISLLLMKPRYPQNTKKAASILNNFRVFLCDIPYVIMIFAWVIYCPVLYRPRWLGAVERHLYPLACTTLYFFSNLILSKTASRLSWPSTQ